MSLLRIIKEHLVRELTDAISAGPDGFLRVTFAGPPKSILERLFDEITPNQECLKVELESESIEIPVFLVDPNTVDPDHGAKVARCSTNYLVGVRNRDYPIFLALHEVSASTIPTLTTATKPLGLVRGIDEFDQWHKAPLIQHIISTALDGVLGLNHAIRDQADQFVEFALAEAWNSDDRHNDRRTVWQLLERLCDVKADNSTAHQLISVALGMVNCDVEEFNSKKHRDMLGRVGEFLMTRGLRGGFDDLESSDDKQLVEHVSGLRAHIERQGLLEASEFAEFPMAVYCPISTENTEVPGWWLGLTVNAWATLLDFSDEDEPSDQLEVKVTNKLIDQRGMPYVVEDQLDFEIMTSSTEETVEVSIHRAVGSSAYELIGNVSLASGAIGKYTDGELPHHERFLRYKIESSDHDAIAFRVISLDSYGPRMLVVSETASKVSTFKLNKKARSADDKVVTRFECEMHFSAMGSHQIDLYSSQYADLAETMFGYEVDAEHTEALARPIIKRQHRRSVCTIETDEECYYEFEVDSSGDASANVFRIYITADDVEPTGARSEFERLIFAHSASAKGQRSNARVEPLSCRVAEYEQWALSDDHSYHPVILGSDYFGAWRKPEWLKFPMLTNQEMLIDPRPAQNSFKAPEDFVVARKSLFAKLVDPESDVLTESSVIRFFDKIRDPNFQEDLLHLLKSYAKWLEQDFDNAAWSDVVAIHYAQAGSNALTSVPQAILLTPWHPIRLAWQCQAQEILEDALAGHMRCPAASMVSPDNFPDCMVLPCNTATGSIKNVPFVSVATDSDYWSVLWCTDSISQIGANGDDDVFGPDFGITIQGLSAGFSDQQVVRTLDEVARLTTSKSTMHAAIASDSAGSGSCNVGITAWCLANLGPEADIWHDAGSRSLIVNDRRDSVHQPEQAALASLTSATGETVKWFSNASSSDSNLEDVSIIAHLGTMNHDFSVQSIRSAIDKSGLIRWRIRKQLPMQNAAFIAESRIGKIPDSAIDDSTNDALLQCVDILERSCASDFDSYVFAPDVETLRGELSRANYAAVSSAGVDAACFFGATDKAYLWDYDLPSYSNRAGENSGYFLLAKESAAMLVAVKSAIKMLSDGADVSDDDVSELLNEISLRGMPTLKKLTAGGTMSLGELGMLLAMRVLQADFESKSNRRSLIPVVDPGKTLNLIVPVDPFKNQFEDLRVALESKRGERPDLAVLSIAYSDGVPVTLKITLVEVKARSNVMSKGERKASLSQASLFSGFLIRIADTAEKSKLWAIAWRSLVATLLEFGFRLYGQLDQFMQHDEWARQHSLVMQALANQDLQIEIDRRGRLFVIDGTNTSKMDDLDDDGLDEVLALSKKDALSILSGEGTSLMDGICDRASRWNLESQPWTDQDGNEEKDDDSGPVAVSSDDAEPEALPEVSRTDQTETESEVTMPSNDEMDEHDESPAIISDDSSEVTQLKSSKAADESDQDNQDTKSQLRFDVGVTVGEFSTENLEFFPGNTELNQLNVGIVGDLGLGKTQLIQALIYRLVEKAERNRGHKPNILIFDYKKDYSKPAFVKATGARIVDPFEIPLNLFSTADSMKKRNVWLERSKFFSDVLDRIYSGIGPVQRERIKQAVREAYDQCADIGQVDPTINDVFDTYRNLQGGKVDAPYSIMSDLVDGGYFVSSSSDVIPFSELLNGVVVLDLAAVGQDDRTKNMLVAIFLNLFYDQMLRNQKKDFIGEDPQLRFVDSYLLVDEADSIMKYEFDVLKKILLQGREFGVGVMLASQYLSHFKTSHENYLEPLLTWFIHKVPNISAKDLEGIGLTNVSADLVNAIKSLEKHECMYKTLDVDGRIIRAHPFYELSKK